MKDVACATRGRLHPVTDSELTFKLPDVVFALSEEEREARCRIRSDIVVLDDARFFIRGLLPLKVANREREHSVSLWAEVSEDEDMFKRIFDLWDEPTQSEERRMLGERGLTRCVVSF